MKKFLSWVISLTLIFSLLPSQALAVSAPDFSSAKEGEKIVVTLTLPDYEKVMTAEAVVEFPGTVFKLESVTSGVYSPLDFEAPNVTTATNNGKVTIAHTNETLGTCTVGGEYAKLTFSIKDGTAPGSYDIKLTELTMSATDYVTNIAASDAATLPKTISVVVPKAPIASVTASVAEPAAGQPLDFTGTVDASAPYSITKVEWFESTNDSGTTVTSPATAKANQYYYARITLTANSGETFAASLDNTISGIYSVARNSETELYLTKVYQTGSLPAASVTAKPTAKSDLKYNGSKQPLLGFVGTATNGTMQYSLDGITWADTDPKGTDAKTYTVYYKAKGNSTHSDSAVASISATIAPKSIADSTVTIGTIAGQPYTGSAITPDPEVKDGTATLEKDKDYTVSCDGTYVGSATLTINGTGNYNGTNTANFNIVAAEQNPRFTTPKDLVSGGHRLDLRTLVSGAKGDVSFTISGGGGTSTYANLESDGYTLTSTGVPGTVNINVNITAKDEGGDSAPEYNAFSKSDAITVNVVDKTAASLTVTQADTTYGTALADPAYDEATDMIDSSLKVTYKGRGTTSYTENTAKPTDAGTYTVKVTYETATEILSGSADFTIGPKVLQSSDLEQSGGSATKVYDGNATSSITVRVKASSLCGTDTLPITGTAVYNSADVAEANQITFTPDPITTGNYTLAASEVLTITTNASITPRDLIVTPNAGQSKKFGAEDPTLHSTNSGRVTGQIPDFSGALSRAEGKDVGQYDITLGSLALIDHFSSGFKASNYELKMVSPAVKFEIKKADARTLADITLSQKYNVTTEQSKDIGTAGMPEDAGTLTYAPGTAIKTGSVAIDSWNVDSTGKVTYKLSNGAVGDTVTLPVTITSDNYENSTVNVKITLTKPSSSGGTSYAITVEKAENGTVSADRRSASKGSTVTITVKPDKGYELDALKVLDKNGDKVKLTEKNGKYTFKMPSGKVTVKGSFVEETPVQIFKDVPVDAYYYEAVKWAAEQGITGGVGNGLFAPNQPCTRGQIVTFLWRAAGSPAPKSMSSFADVPADAFYAKAVAWAVENGITGGTGDGKFSPDATCTRAQSVTFLYRAAGSPKVSGSAEFGDVATNAYYADAVAWAAKNGITGGIGGGLFGSNNDCTRAQIVTFLYRSAK